MSYRVQSLERGINILKALASGPRTITEVARETGLAKGTAFRLMASLSYEQFVVREPGGSRYLLGPGLLPLMAHIHSTFGWIGALAGEPLRALWRETGETVVVHLRVGAQRVCVEELPSAQPMRYNAAVGSTAPIHVGSAGKVLLASMEDGELGTLLPTLELSQVTDQSISDLTTLKHEIELARGRGWAMSLGERIEGAASVSVPVRMPGMWAALSVLGPAVRMTPEIRERFVTQAEQAAKSVEALVQAPPAPPEEAGDA